jgi:hypothetical protein
MSVPDYRTPAPLTDDQVNILTNQDSATKAYVSFVPVDSLTATARIKSPQTFDDTVADIEIDSQSSNWGDLFDGATVAIGTAPGLEDVGIYRIRAVNNPDILKIGEIGVGDPGLRPLNKTTALAAGQYVTAYLVDKNIWSALTRIVYTGTVATFYKDYDLLYTGQTDLPYPTLRMGTHLATFATPGFNVARISFTLGGKVWESQPLDTYTYILPPGSTVITGDITGSCGSFTGDGPITATTINVDIPVGFHIVRAFVTTTGSSYITNVFRLIWVHDSDVPGALFPPYSILNGQITKDRTGWEVSATLIGDDIKNQKLSALCQVWDRTWWNEQEQLTVGRTTFVSSQYTGWISNDIVYEETGNGERNTQITVSSATSMMENIPTSSLVLDALNPAVNWNQARPALVNAEFWMDYVLRWHVPNSTQLFDEYYYSTGTDALYQTIGLTAPSGSVLNAIQNIVRRSNLNFGIDSDGRYWLRPHPSMIPYADRTTAKVPVRLTLTPNQYYNPRWSRRPFMLSRRVDGAGFWYDASKPINSEKPQPVRSTAYGGTWSQAVSSESFTDALVEDQDDLNIRTGLRQAYLNNPYGVLTLSLVGNWDILSPAWLSFVRVQIPASLNPTGMDFNERCIPLTLTKRWLEGGAVDTELSLEVETAGQPGITVGIKKKVIKPPPPPPPPKPEGWTRTWIFTTTEYAATWELADSGGTSGWTSGVGWYRGPNIWIGTLQTSLTSDDDTTTLDTVTFEVGSNYSSPATGGYDNIASFGYDIGAGFVTTPTSFPYPSGTVSFSPGIDCNKTGTNFKLNISTGDRVDHNERIRWLRCTMSGSGTDPVFTGE